jgi:hypothetical protein
MRLKIYLVLSSSLFFHFYCVRRILQFWKERSSRRAAVFCHKRTYVCIRHCRDCCLQEIGRRVLSLSLSLSHLADRYSKLCPGFRAGTSIVTWWLTTPTKATPYSLSQIGNYFLSIICHVFCYFYGSTKVLTKAAPKSWRIIRGDLSASGRFVFSVIFIHSVSSRLFGYCYFIFPISTLSLRVLPLLFLVFFCLDESNASPSTRAWIS